MRLRIINRVSPARGFTLIEVMIALLIIALSMMAVMFANSSASNRLLYLQEKNESMWVAKNVLAQTLTGEKGLYLQPGSRKGEISMGPRNYLWQINIRKDKPWQLNLVVRVQRLGDEQLLLEWETVEPYYEQS